VVSSTSSEAIASAYGIITNYRSVYRKKLEIKAYVADRILRSIRGSLPIGQSLKDVFGKLGYSFDNITDSTGSNILENIVVEQFSNQPEMKDIDKNEPSSFELVSNLVMLLSGLDDSRMALGFDTIYALPQAQIQGQIEEVYMNLRKQAREISTIRGGD
jgi:hypothetical protein